MKHCAAFVGALSAFSLAALAAAGTPFRSEEIFPPEDWHNHASCIVEAPDGSLLVTWYHGSGERQADDVVIEGARRQPGQEAWGSRFLMADTPGYPDCNPALFVDAKRRLWLFWPTIIDHQWESAILKYRVASDWYSSAEAPKWDWQDLLHITPTDLGPRLLAASDALPDWIKERARTEPRFEVEVASWRERAGNELYQRLGWMPRAHPTQLKSGKWILPLYCDTFSISLMAIMDEEGRLENLSSPLIGFGNIQPSVVERQDGGLLALMRENGATGRIRSSESSDGGLTWGPVGQLELPNPGSGLEVIGLANGHWALIYNDTLQGRHSLAVSISDDEGKTWGHTRHVELDESRQTRAHYPSIMQAADGLIHASYSFHSPEGSCIKHAQFDEEWVRAGDE